MKVLDLFAGLKGWATPFVERGHDVFTVDYDPRFETSLVADIGRLEPDDLPWQPDIILASPPCEKFSVMSFGANWLPGYIPKPQAEEAIALVQHTLDLIYHLQPAYWIMENPVGLLRKMPMMQPLERRTVWYCHVGEKRSKPTDLWGRFPPSLTLPGACHNQRTNHPDDCCCRDHFAAPRGSRTGTQGFGTYADRSKIPHELARRVCIAAERDLEAGAPPIPRAVPIPIWTEAV
jgi:hypothetical protein